MNPVVVLPERAPARLAAGPSVDELEFKTDDGRPPTVSGPPDVRDPAERRDRVGEQRPREVSPRPLDDWMALVGSGLGSLGLVWLLYEQILPLSGTVGFILCWYLAFLGVYGAVTAMSHPRPVVVDRVMSAVVHAGAFLVGAVLVVTVSYPFVRGWQALRHINLYTQDMGGVRPTAPLTHGGLLHAIVGSLIEVGIAACIALPLGIGTAVFMTEVGGPLARGVRSVVEAMTALPDILAGLFIYATMILRFGLEPGGLAAALALTVMMLPIIARTSDLALRTVPGGLREAGLALGSSQWQTIRRVVLPTAKTGLATALILGIARAVGETAPVLITSGASTYFNKDPLHQTMNSLPLYIYSAVRSGETLNIARGFAAAAVLLAIVLALFAVVRILARQSGTNR